LHKIQRLLSDFIRDEDVNIDQSNKNEKSKYDEEDIDDFIASVFESGFDAGKSIHKRNHGKRDVHDVVYNERIRKPDATVH